ncbi:MAG: hypothetical protein LAO19_14955 [Acidobacteriia bacterium]|nr:hypothetical protein [Terriglobia bacterium]
MSEMTCREFDEIVHGYVRMELLDVRLREAALEHTAVCSLCAGRLAEAIALAESTEAVSRRAQHQQAPPQVEAAVLAGFRSHHQRNSWRRTFEWSSIGAAAAILLIVFWTFVIRYRVPAQPAPKKDVSSHSSAPLDAKGAAVSPANDGAQASDKDEADSAVDASTVETYVASDFVPVPFTGAIAPDDPGMVVRVELTRASLAQLGYPVAEAPDDDLIQADVLVGEDGWPRGVKLVQ